MPTALAAVCIAALARPVLTIGIESSEARLGLARGRDRNASSGGPFLSPRVASSLAGMEVDRPSEDQMRDMYGILQHLYAGVPVDFRQTEDSAVNSTSLLGGRAHPASNSTANSTSLRSGRAHPAANSTADSTLGTRMSDFGGTWRLKQVAGDIEAVLFKMSVTPIVIFTLKHLDWGVGTVYETIAQADDTFSITTTTGLSHEKKTQTFTVGMDFEMASEDKSDDGNIAASSAWDETKGELTNTYQHGLFKANMARALRDGDHMLETLTVWDSTMYLYWEPPAAPTL
mmetsp:Transcript_101588/g.287850  ORF Transcript_101588/g.287850 Transcript_101588/m.287850 type:complete len:287 (+) Transcript_101588:61-921(+)